MTFLPLIPKGKIIENQININKNILYVNSRKSERYNRDKLFLNFFIRVDIFSCVIQLKANYKAFIKNENHQTLNKLL